jgi:flagellar protein FlaG
MDMQGAKQVSLPATAVAGTGAPKAPPQVETPVVAPEATPALSKVAEHLRAYLNSSRRDLEFHVDTDSRQTVIIVRNASTGEVVRQIPNEEAMRMARYLNEGSATLLDLTA